MKERPLILFTLLSQIAVGFFWALGAVHTWAALSQGRLIADQLTSLPLVVIVLLVLSSLAASFFHLGSPQNAWRALANLRSSWLSREILFALLFSGAVVILCVFQWISLEPSWLRDLLAVTVAVFGLALVYCMSRVYMLRTVPGWQTWFTPYSFFASTFLLGGLAAGFIIAVHQLARDDLLRIPLAWIAALSTLLLGSQAVLLPLYLLRLQTDSSAARKSVDNNIRENGLVFTLRLVLIVVALILVILLFYLVAFSPELLSKGLLSFVVFLAFTATITSEIFGRYLFYESYARLGV
jgi:anaerobic dimethyl sulfoxide reductase subunit C